MDIKTITEKVKGVFDAHKDEEHVEVEIRLGKHNGALFDTNVGREIFERVLKGLKKYDGWETTKTTTTEVYYDDTNGIRISSDEDTGEQSMVQKINVVKEDFKCEPLDVRFSISREIPTHGSYEMDRKRSKFRHSFVRKNLSIDMTVSSGDTVDMDSEDASSYQIELEIVKPGDVKSYNELFNILYKIHDLSKLI
jgi:hypothetical protein